LNPLKFFASSRSDFSDLTIFIGRAVAEVNYSTRSGLSILRLAAATLSFFFTRFRRSRAFRLSTAAQALR